MPKTPEHISPEDEAKIEESRTLSDAELIRGGAHYVPTKEGRPRLEVTDRQRKLLRQEGEDWQNELNVVRDFISASCEKLASELRYRREDYNVQEALNGLAASSKDIKTLQDARAALYNIFYAIRVGNHFMNKPYSKELLKEGDLDYKMWQEAHEFLDVLDGYIKTME